MSRAKPRRPKPQTPPGFVDRFASDLDARSRMLATIERVYRLWGFEPLETPAVEYLDVLGKYLPESDEPAGGVFAFRDDDDQWLALRYDLTAPLSRVFAQYAQSLPRPFRRYQIGPVWRREKPGRGRFRQFTQCDFDTVGASGPEADAEAAALLVATFEALGLGAGDFQVRINDRKVLNGVLDAAGVPEDPRVRLTVLRAVDKLDRVGLDGVRALLGPGRRDPSGDFTPGAQLPEATIDHVLAFVQAGGGARAEVCRRLRDLVGDSDAGKEGVDELEHIDGLLSAMGLEEQAVVFDPSIVRGLAYYTGPVLEGVLTFEIRDDKGRLVPFGAVAGGGRYDGLVERFTGQKVPATGASIGIDRLLAALSVRRGRAEGSMRRGPVVVTVFDRSRMADYLAMVAELRAAGIAAELYLGRKGLKGQLKYADRRAAPAAIIAGEDEFARGEVAIKDLVLGTQLAQSVESRDAWRKGQPAQRSVPRGQLVEAVRAILAGEDARGEESP